MTEKKPGFIIEITEGAYKGAFGIMYHHEQTAEIQNQKKGRIHVYQDRELKKPHLAFGKPLKFTIFLSKIRQIGFSD